MSPVRLTAAERRAVVDHAASAFPEEACGILIGRQDGRVIEVAAVEATPNAWPGDRRHRYEIPPERLLAAHRAARSTGRRVVGYYHSHPSGGAAPSAFDRERAWPDTLYLIVGLEQGGADAGESGAEVRAYRLIEGGGFVEEAIE